MATQITHVAPQQLEPIVPLELEPGEESRYRELRRRRRLVLPVSKNGRRRGSGLRVIPLGQVEAALRDASGQA
jgi:hypothetical protein